MVEVSTFSNQLVHFRAMRKAKIILWEESGAFDAGKRANQGGPVSAHIPTSRSRPWARISMVIGLPPANRRGAALGGVFEETLLPSSGMGQEVAVCAVVTQVIFREKH